MIVEDLKETLKKLDLYLDKNLLLISSFRERSFLYQSKFLLQAPVGQFTLVLVPNSQVLKREIAQLENISELAKNYIALSSDLLPKQYRQSLLKLAEESGKQNMPRVVFSTPEPFLRLFSNFKNQRENLPSSKSENEKLLNLEVQEKTGLVFQKIRQIVFCDADLLSKEGTLHKKKYLETLKSLKTLGKRTWALASSSNQASLNELYTLFPELKVLYVKPRLDFITLRPELFFSENQLEKNLINACLKINKSNNSTLIVTDEEKLFQLAQSLRERIDQNKAKIDFKIFHNQIPLDERASIFDLLLKNKPIVLLTSRDLLWQISEVKAKLAQLIYYSNEFSLRDLSQDLSYLSFDLSHLAKNSSKLIVKFLIQSKDLREKSERITSHKRLEGLDLNIKEKNKELLEWLTSSKDCRLASFQKILFGSSLEELRCQTCDICLREKKSLLWKLQLSILKKQCT